MVFAAWRAWQEAQGLSERTIKERAATLRSLAPDPLTVTPEQIIQFCGRPNLAPASRASYHASIRAFYAWAVKAGHLDVDPSLSTPRPKRPKNRPRPLQAVHVSALLNAANRKRTRAMITLATYAGMRVHEIAKMHGGDLDQVGRTLTITGKGGKTALIPAHDAIMEIAEEFPRFGHWFPAYNGAPHVGAHAVSKAIRGAMRRAGFDAKPHQLRHYYATELLDQGVDVRIVKELMRHESLATTEIYTQVSLVQMRAGMDALPLAA